MQHHCFDEQAVVDIDEHVIPPEIDDERAVYEERVIPIRTEIKVLKCECGATWSLHDEAEGMIKSYESHRENYCDEWRD